MATGCSSDFTTGYECPICFDLFNSSESAKTPRTLICNHFFCHECLDNIVEQNQICCPLCRTPTAVDYGNLSQLPVHTFPPLSEEGDLDVNCQLLVLSLYEQIEEYKKESRETLLEEKLKANVVQARQREDELLKELEHYKMLAERMKVFKREVIRIDINKGTLMKEIAELMQQLEVEEQAKKNANERSRQFEAFLHQTQIELTESKREKETMRKKHNLETRQLKRKHQDDSDYHSNRWAALKREKEENEGNHYGIQRDLNSKIELSYFICIILVVLLVLSVSVGTFICYGRNQLIVEKEVALDKAKIQIMQKDNEIEKKQKGHEKAINLANTLIQQKEKEIENQIKEHEQAINLANTEIQQKEKEIENQVKEHDTRTSYSAARIGELRLALNDAEQEIQHRDKYISNQWRQIQKQTREIKNIQQSYNVKMGQIKTQKEKELNRIKHDTNNNYFSSLVLSVMLNIITCSIILIYRENIKLWLQQQT